MGKDEETELNKPDLLNGILDETVEID